MRNRTSVLAMRLLAVAGLAALAHAIVRYLLLPGGGPGALFGSIHAPYSDALGPWLRGGLTLHLYGTIEPFVYRPTLALFYASAFALANRIEVIPILAAALLLGILALVLLVRTPRPATLAAILTVAVLSIAHRASLAHLSIGSINVDFPLFALILSGTVLIVIALDDATVDRPLLLTGFLCLGVGAALRGTVLLGGLLVLATLLLLRPRLEVRSVVLLALAFLTPSAVDSILARQHGTLNNGVIALFCVYDDPSHSWTSPCHSRYLAQRPPAAEVMAGYRHFLASEKGPRLVANNIRYRLLQDGRLVRSKAFLWAGLALLALRTWRLSRESSRWVEILRDRPLILGWAVLALLAAGVAGPSAMFPSAVGAALIAALSGALLLGLRPAVAALLIYVGGATTMSLLFVTVDRVGASFSFSLVLGLMLLFVGPSEERDTPRVRLSVDTAASAGAAALVVVALINLYLGHHVFPSTVRDAFRSEVEGRQAALKLSDDLHLGLSLYLFPQGHLGYAVLDEAPLGSVRKYERLEPGSMYNDSFQVPNRFVGLR